jgi:gliding motility-associated lipoprotein GldH
MFAIHKTDKLSLPLHVILLSNLICLCSSCDPNRIYEENKDIPEMLWHKDSIMKFEVEISDAQAKYNLYINVRNAGSYQFSNIYMFVDIAFPDGTINRDTVEGILADEKGQWLGNGLGDIWDNQIPFKNAVRFPLAGKYIFKIEQAMRAEQLSDIMDVGLRVEKEKKD